ncbi:hypothetical protein DU002_18350 [Corallincola holothuriorum]|uniref:Uncharacterized protein n=2 Tax=Corallincola holothuriorum TaxID=2282215 RepID=A0A368N2Z1_9GAMM|nr:hypothetical protein DU002_18350 [Corallincola holothuriorum]
MKLGNTKTEREFREQMSASKEALLFDRSCARLRSAIEAHYADFESGCVLHWTEEQCEDIFVLLVNGPKLMSVELDRFEESTPPVVESISMAEYRKGLKKINQIRLAVALEVISE